MNKSVTRRLIALLFAVCGAGVFTYLALQGVSEAFVALNTAVGLVLGYYLGVQASK